MKTVIPFKESIEKKLELGTIPDPVLPPLLSFQETCEYLGIGHTTLNDMLRTGELHYTRVRNRIRIFATDIRAYLDSRKSGNEE